MNQLTLLVPTRNRPGLLTETLASILQGFGSGQQVTIGDNGDPEPTKKVIASFPNLTVTHLTNPARSTYIDNLDILVRSCQTEWLSILHDDDVYCPKAGERFESIISAHQDVDFIFSTHPIIDELGKVNEEKTVSYGKTYRREEIPEGVTDLTSYYAARCSVALDGFFVKTSLAQSVTFDTSFAVYDDNRWLIDVCSKSVRGYYSRTALFAYRVCEDSLTSECVEPAKHFKFRLEAYRALGRTTVSCPQARRALAQRRRQLLKPLAGAWIRQLFPILSKR